MVRYQHIRLQLPMKLRESPGPIVRTPEHVADQCRDMLPLAQEVFTVLLLNRKYRIIDRVMVSLGIVDSALVHPREVFRAAIAANAVALVLVHNHPSGDVTPSAEDLRVTRQIVQAGLILGIEVIDHVIIGQETDVMNRCSIRETGLVRFNDGPS